MNPYVGLAVISLLSLGLVLVFITGRGGNSRYRRNLARHPLTSGQRALALLAVALWIAALFVNQAAEGVAWMLLFLAGPALAFGVWALWERDEPEHRAV